MKKWLLEMLFFCCVLFFTPGAIAQDATTSGTVSDADGPLIGVNILEKGTTNGVVTDFNGDYTITTVSDNPVLIFSYIGYLSQEIAVNGRSKIDVMMEGDAKALDEVVIVGYGTSSKKDLTGSVASIRKKEIENVVAGNPVASFQGKLVGVQVETFGGQPGGSANVFIRGVNSLSNASPLYVVDGLFVENLDNINQNDIQDITVLKDAAASAIYGSRAANGVIIVNTNHGQNANGEVEVTLRARVGVDTPSKKLDYLNGEQYTNYLNQRFQNDGEADRVTWNEVNTDWQEENLSSALVQEIGVGIAGGTQKASFFASANHFKQDGILVGSGFERANFRINSRAEFGKFSLTQSLGITQSKLQENNWFGWDGVSVPTLNRTSSNEGGFEAPSLPIHGPGGVNQFGLASLEENLRTTRNFYGSAKFDYHITDAFTASLNFGLDFKATNAFQFTPTFFMSSVDAVLNVNQQNDLTDFRQNDLNTLVEPTLSYNKEFGESRISAVAGYTYFKETSRSNGLFGQGTPANGIRTTSALAASDQLIILGANNGAGLISAFGRINYNYGGKYILEATIRRDASSRFAEENRVGYFPSFSAGWNIRDESFFTSEKFDYLKLRASYGELGSYPNVYYPTQAVSEANQSNVSFGGVTTPGLSQTTLADPSLVWETTKTFDIGVDFSLLNDKFIVTMDYFSKNIEDVLVAINIPSTGGVSLPVTRNAGTLINKGLELDFTYRKKGGDFTYSIGTNFSFNLESKAGDLPNPILGPAIDEDLRIVNRTFSNQPIGAYYGYIVEDKVNPTTGDFVRRDINGDGVITADDQTVIGDPTPDFVYGINFNANYKNWDFGLAFNGVQGNEIYNLSRYYSILWQDGGKLSDVLDSWTPTNTDTSIPRASISDPAGNKAPSSFFVEDGSYLRLKNVDIGYTLNESPFGIDWIKNVRLSLNIQNLFVLTKYSGYDPDVSSTNGGRANRNTGVPGLRDNVNPLLGRGLDARAYPNARTFMFGVQATF